MVDDVASIQHGAQSKVRAAHVPEAGPCATTFQSSQGIASRSFPVLPRET